jgi:uncharacterized protein YprB with RNaseH-like and TPR domain
MQGFPDAYLDIETTGLDSWASTITVVGIYFANECEGRLVQLYDDKLSKKNLLKALDGSEYLYTYNGKNFDLPFIRMHFGPDLSLRHQHKDLMYDCWRYNLKGGFKAVLRRLGISRETEGINGLDAVRLWHQYKMEGDMTALDLLLRYNRDDVVNLKQLRECLTVMDLARKTERV